MSRDKTPIGPHSRNFQRLSLCGHASMLALSVAAAAAMKTERLEFTIQRRAADLQPTCHFRHLPAVMGNCIPDQLGFELFERPHVPLAIEQGQSIDQPLDPARCSIRSAPTSSLS